MKGGDALNDLSDLHVLDMQPSLRTLALLAVSKYKLRLSSLPEELILQLQNISQDNPRVPNG